MTDALNVEAGGMGRRISEVYEPLHSMIIAPGFVEKLAAQNEWTIQHATEVYQEYLRFLIMAWMSPTMVVPSNAVDQAWHLHLTYTRHYWDTLCGDILQKPLHHDPAQATSQDARRHADHYLRTLSLYRYLFQEEPPAGVWPVGCSGDAGQERPVILASPAGVTVGALALAAGVTAAFSGHVFMGGSIIVAYAVVAILYGRTASAAAQRRKEAPFVSRSVSIGKTASIPSRTGGSKSGSGSTRTETLDQSGSDAAVAFAGWIDAPAASTHGHGTHGSHGGHGADTPGHSHSHSCGGHSHSCGGGGHSCGGGGCGGGGD